MDEREVANERVQELLGDEPQRVGNVRPLQAPPLPPPEERGVGVQGAAIIVLAVLAVLAFCYVAKLILVALLLAMLIAFMLEPAVELLASFRMPRAVAAGIVMLILGGLLYLGGYFVYAKTMDFLDDLPRYSQKVRHIMEDYRARASKIEQSTQTEPPKPPDKNTVTVQQTTDWAGYLTSSLGTFTEFVLAASFIPFLVFFMLTWQEHVRAATVMLFKMENRNTAYVTLGRISKMIKAFMLGNLLIGAFVAAISTIVFFALGLPNALVLGVLSGYLSLVPYLGVVLAVIPPVIAALGQETTPEILVIILTILGLHLFAINVLYPKVLGRRLQLNPLAVTIALLCWGWLWGAWGLILAIPITAAMKIIFDHIEALQPYGAWMGE